MDGVTSDRWKLTGLARRILETAQWRYDLLEFMGSVVSQLAIDNWGRPSIAIDLLKMVVGKIAQLYRLAPVFSNPDATDEAQAYLKELNPFKRHRRINRLTIGLRECHVRVHWRGETGADPEIVTPDYVVPSAPANNPTVPNKIAHAVHLKDPRKSNVSAWFWEAWDISDLESPKYMILDAQWKDVSSFFDLAPDYSWIDTETGVPYMPWILYHAEDTGALYDPAAWMELIDGTLMVGVLATFWTHIVKNASWNQPFGLDVELRGLTPTSTGEKVSRVPTDPTSLLMFDSISGKTGQLGNLERPADPQYVIQAIIQYAEWVLSQVGLGVEQAQQAPQSGVALSIRHDGVVRLQQEYVTAFRTGDKEYLRVLSQVTNSFSDADVPTLPTSGWRIKYPAAPQTRDEIVAKLAQKKAQIEMGLLSPVDVIMEMELGLTRVEALAELIRIQDENKLVAPPATVRIGEITAALDVARAVGRGEITREAGAAILETMLGVEAVEAARLVGTTIPQGD